MGDTRRVQSETITPASSPPKRKQAASLTLFALAFALANTGLWILAFDANEALGVLFVTFTVLAVAQFVIGIVAIVLAIQSLRAQQGGVGSLLGSIALTLGAPVGWFLGVSSVALIAAGGA